MDLAPLLVDGLRPELTEDIDTAFPSESYLYAYNRMFTTTVNHVMALTPLALCSLTRISNHVLPLCLDLL